ncbi:MAG: VIT domain-containing protein [Pseudoxanthomonas sp.]
MKHRIVFIAVTAAVIACGFGASAQQARIAIAPPLFAAPQAQTPVQLQSAQVEVSTAGSLARTTLLLSLHNPNDRQLEGTLQFPLQPGQQVTAFALDIDGKLRDAVPVPKEKGRQVFESIERRQVDPALLEQTAGNQFRLRVYPVPPRGQRTVKLVIDETMQRDGNNWRMQLPLHLLSNAAQFGLHVRAQGVRSAPQVEGTFDTLPFKRANGGFEADVSRQAFRAQTGLSLRFPATDQAQVYTAAHGDERYVLAEIPVAAAMQPRTIPNHVGLLWDASASARKRDRDAEFALLDRYFTAMGNGRVQLRLLRDVGEDGGEFEIRNGDWAALRSKLQATANDGASNLADWTPQTGIGEYLLVSDGLHNYGDAAFPQLATNQRLYALASSGPLADATRLTSLSESRGGRVIAWQGRAGLQSAANALLQDGARVAALRGEGVTDLLAQSRLIEGGVLRVAGRLLEPRAVLQVELDTAGKRQQIKLPLSASAGTRPQIAQAWATWRVARLSAEPQLNRAAIERLGQDFSLVTAGTSLLVLDDVADYVRYDITPPAELRATFDEMRGKQHPQETASRTQQLDKIAAAFAERIAWWEKKWPKDAPKTEEEIALDAVSVARPSGIDSRARRLSASPSAVPVPPPPPAPAMMDIAASVAPIAAETAQEKGSSQTAGQGVSIALKPWLPDSPSARRLREATPEQVYTIYLDERDGNADSTAFYLDAADVLLEKGQRALALRVLSNLAEMELESRHILRVLGYRLLQADAPQLALPVFKQVREIAGEEPQSHRDLGLTLAATGQPQAAIEALYEVVSRPWDGRFNGIDLIALGELNAIVARARTPLDTRRIDPRLLRNLPLDLRAVLTWDSDNSDMDLWVTDPNGEKCFYSHKLTYQGGLISNDFTGGYGPEEFVLRDAKPGKYKVEANFYGERQQLVTGATTVQLQFITGFATLQQKEQRVTIRLKQARDTVFVGEFEVK